MKSLIGYLSFTGQAGCYAELPLAVLAGATTFTIEAKFSTTSTKNSSSNYSWQTIAGREISGYWQDDFGLCVNGGKLCFWAEPKSGGSSSTNNTTSSAIVNDGEIHKVAVVSSNGAIDLYCDSVLVAHTDNVNAKISAAQTIMLAYNTNSASRLQMDLYELRLWKVARSAEEIFADITGTETGLQGWYLPTADGLKDYSGNDRHATLYGSPAYNELTELTVSFTADVERKLSNRVEFTADIERKVIAAWRYFNAGTADTLTVTGTTLTDLPETKSVTGTAFYQTAREKCFDLPSTAEIWLKFDVYFDGSNRWRAYNDSSGGGGVLNGISAQQTSSGTGTLSFFASTNKSIYQGENVTKKNQLQTVLLHMVSGSSAGVIEAWVDGTKIYTYTGDVNHGQDFADIYLQSDGAGTFFSNVVISNKQLTVGDGYQKFTADVERRVKNIVEFTVPVERVLIEPIIIPFLMGDHFNHLIQNIYLSPNVPKKIVLPKTSKVYLHADGTNGDAVRIYSDTDDTGTVTGDVYAALDACKTVYIKSVVSPQSILDSFMYRLRNKGAAGLDEAINDCTGGLFASKDDVINSFLNDLDNSSDFLKNCCGVILDNEDTGAAIGSDAGGGYPKNAEMVVPEPVPVEDWVVPEKGSSKKIEGLTVNFPTSGHKGTFTDAEKHILAGLNSVWIEQALILIKKSCGLTFINWAYSGLFSVGRINVKFVDEQNTTLAYVAPKYRDGWAYELNLCVNMYIPKDKNTAHIGTVNGGRVIIGNNSYGYVPTVDMYFGDGDKVAVILPENSSSAAVVGVP